MRLDFGDLSIEGASRAGDRTWFRVHPPGLAFDVGRGALALAGVEDVFLTHGHLDHALGLPFVLSYRARHGAGTTRVGCPAAVAGVLDAWLAGAAQLEGSEYDYQLIGMDPGDGVDVGHGMRVEAFATDHVVPSLGYHLTQPKKRLSERYRGLSGDELASLRERGEVIEETVRQDRLSYCGDTSATVLDTESRLFKSRLLLIECSFLAPGHRERAHRYGHVHLDDLVERQERFENEKIILCHLSRRHSLRELEAAVRARLGALSDRVEYAVA